MSSDPSTARASAGAWRLDRSYDSFAEMAREEAVRADGIDFVIIVTPNHLHFPVARAFLEAGIHAVCEKPLALNLEEGEQLVALVEREHRLFAVTHPYSGYPLIREARAMVREGLIGELRKVMVEYNQDWLMSPVERSGSKQAAWRTDPAQAGISCCVGDIGSHAEQLLEYVTGRRITSLCADLSSFVPGRTLDDDANILLRLEGGAKGTLVCSQIACGEENALTIRIYGSKSGLEWRQQEPNSLLYKPAGSPWQILRTGQSHLGEAARAATRLPGGHPEGYFEAFAVIYRDFIADVRRLQRGEAPQRNYPTVQDGLRGLQFIAKAVESSNRGAQWVSI